MFLDGVALLVSAWIEIIIERKSCVFNKVALLVSAWIEICLSVAWLSVVGCRTPCECVD